MEYIKISSLKRSSGTPSNFACQFTKPLQEGTYKLVSATMSNSYYNINNDNNKIYFNEDGGATLTATLTNGFYSSADIASNIENAMEAVSLSSGLNVNYTVTFNANTNKLTISSGGGHSFAFKFASNTTSSADRVLGFPLTDTSTSSSQTSNTPINLVDTLSYNISLQGQNITSNIQDNSNTIYSFAIPINSNSLGIFNYEPYHNITVNFNNPVYNMKVIVYNEKDNELTLFHDWYMILERIC